MARIIVLSDIHLSPTHGFFWQNWCVARDFADAAKADAVVINGDLAINGPDSDAEIAFAATALKSLSTRVVALPGNHDVGDEPPGQDPDQIIDAARLARWDGSFGSDRWTLNAGRWLLVGVNAQLFGSALPREHAQDQWLDERLSAAAGRPVALFLHKPLFLQIPPIISSLPRVWRLQLARACSSGYIDPRCDWSSAVICISIAIVRLAACGTCGCLPLPSLRRRSLAAMAAAASRCSISRRMVSRLPSNGSMGWSRTT